MKDQQHQIHARFVHMHRLTSNSGVIITNPFFSLQFTFNLSTFHQLELLYSIKWPSTCEGKLSDYLDEKLKKGDFVSLSMLFCQEV